MPELTINNIIDWNEVPGSNTYFRTSDVAPFITDDNTLNIYNSRGQRRSWGTPSVDSKVTKITDDVVMVTVVGWHKHTVGPVGGTFYFVNDGGQWVRRRANANAVKAVLAMAS
jgi:hypothetical protein